MFYPYFISILTRSFQIYLRYFFVNLLAYLKYTGSFLSLPSNFSTFSTSIVTSKNPFRIGCADGILTFLLMFSYGQRSKCADLLNPL